MLWPHINLYNFRGVVEIKFQFFFWFFLTLFNTFFYVFLRLHEFWPKFVKIRQNPTIFCKKIVLIVPFFHFWAILICSFWKKGTIRKIFQFKAYHVRIFEHIKKRQTIAIFFFRKKGTLRTIFLPKVFWDFVLDILKLSFFRSQKTFTKKIVLRVPFFLYFFCDLFL